VAEQQPTAWHAMAESEVLERLGTDAAAGLSRAEAARRLAERGRNAFPEARRRTLARMVADQFKEFLVLILVAATGVSFAVGETTDGFVILAILVLNAVLGVTQERKADRALEALKKMAVPLCEVVRDGQPDDVSSEEVVPGDVVVLREGDFVPADLRLLEAPNLRIEEASLTGESLPVEKAPATLPADTPLPDRSNMAYAGTHVVYGRGRGVAVATGMDREIGRIAQMLEAETKEQTPLQRNLAGLGKFLGIGALAVCVLVFALGVLGGEDTFEMFMTAVSLAVAAIPEGLPAIVTIVLALGVYRMSRHNAIIRRLPAVETLGCATVICTDKTGTLTENRMTVRRAVTMDALADGADAPSPEALASLLRIAVLCNDAQVQHRAGEEERFGDPTELALLDYAEQQGIRVAELREAHPRIAEVPFDSQRKMMSTLHDLDGSRRLLVKGAPSELLARSMQCEAGGAVRPLADHDRERLRAAEEAMAGQALRVLAFAWKAAEGRDSVSADDESDLVFVGLIGMMDPPRDEVKAAVREARAAGIQAIMITGDNALTGQAIAREIGLMSPDDEALTGRELAELSDDELERRIGSVRVFARVWPEQKLRIVEALQRRGQVVAMTGDGVNDAPALKKADIGVAMGITGTEVAKETSDMVLADDDFATIVRAIKEGRVIFANIRKFVTYLLACNVGEILAIFVPVLLRLGSPLRPVQILLVNLVTDGLVALSLGVDAPEPGVMRERPRAAKSGIVRRADLAFLLYSAAFIALAVIAAYLGGLWLGGRAKGRTMAFATMAIAELWRAYSFRSASRNFWQINPLTNLYLVAACLSSGAIVAATIVVEPLRLVLGNTALSAGDWATVLALSLIPFAACEAWVLVRRLLARRAAK